MFEDGDRTPQLTPGQTNLRLVETRIRGISIHDPDSPELARMEAARADIIGRMSSEELTAYERLVNPVRSQEQIRAQKEAERAAMDANKDRPPI